MRRSLSLLALLASLAPLPASAAPYLTGYVGIFNVLGDQDDDRVTQLGAEYRFEDAGYGLRPTLGFSVDWDGGLYGYGGVNWDIALWPNELYLIPNFMVGAYSEGGSRDLGGPIEFRSGLELAYQLSNAHRVGVAFNHISNAGIYDRNPGAETLLINYSAPTNALFAR